MMIPTFFALFTGIGFLFAALVAIFYPDAFFIQMIAVSLFMVIGVIIFKKKRIADIKANRVGTHNEFVGVEGVAKVSLSADKEGEVELSTPIVGSRFWPAITLGEEIESGCKIKIVELQGNTLLVKKIKG